MSSTIEKEIEEDIYEKNKNHLYHRPGKPE